jgi:hypothetical protein
MTKIIFNYEFETDRAKSLSYEHSREEDEKLDVFSVDGTPFLHLNRSGMLTLSRILIKMAHGEHEDGFHIHLRQDFNEDLPEKLILGLSGSKATQTER